MRKVERNEACPCGSGLKFKKCCGPALDGTVWPETPEALMRSRYTAYVTGNTAHLFRTTHPDNDQVQGTDPEQFHRETLQFCKAVEFTGLTVSQVWPEDEQGVARVRFTAAYRGAAKEEAFTELSDFVRLDGRWVYLHGKEESAREG
ncbi:MAG TPA: YchJ family metal-binding protein [Symbiobacteriaceae bacterium]|nr:YchJ family metal-binding protein [Symbiobacteriaceae bacterium]